MRLSPGQYAIRVLSGLGLLLLPAVQQKLCAFPVRTESRSHPPVKQAPTSKDEQKRKHKKPLTLAALLPDVAPPRWPNHTHLSAAQRVRPPAVTSWMNRPVDGGDCAAGDASVDEALAAGWPTVPPVQRQPSFGNAGIRFVRATRHTFRTCIVRTGPPTA
jgi:hypothetical protein